MSPLDRIRIKTKSGGSRTVTFMRWEKEGLVFLFHIDGYKTNDLRKAPISAIAKDETNQFRH